VKIKIDKIGRTENQITTLKIDIEQTEIEKKRLKHYHVPFEILELSEHVQNDEIKKLLESKPRLRHFDIDHFLSQITDIDVPDSKIKECNFYHNEHEDYFDLKIEKIELDDLLINKLESCDHLSVPKPDLLMGLTTDDIENLKKTNKPSAVTDVDPSGSCWWCSYQYASLNYSNWYDGFGYYRYYNTCTCSIMMGCGSSGSVANGYCGQCGASYPTVTINTKTNRWGLFTYHSHCSACGYDVYYSY
jgi:hypothetical protein